MSKVPHHTHIHMARKEHLHKDHKHSECLETSSYLASVVILVSIFGSIIAYIIGKLDKKVDKDG